MRPWQGDKSWYKWGIWNPATPLRQTYSTMYSLCGLTLTIEIVSHCVFLCRIHQRSCLQTVQRACCIHWCSRSNDDDDYVDRQPNDDPDSGICDHFLCLQIVTHWFWDSVLTKTTPGILLQLEWSHQSDLCDGPECTSIKYLINSICTFWAPISCGRFLKL